MTTTAPKEKHAELTFKQLNAAIAFVKIRFDLKSPTHRQLADLVNKEFNTNLSERDIDRHFDEDDDVLWDQSRFIGETIGFYPGFNFAQNIRMLESDPNYGQLYNEREE